MRFPASAISRAREFNIRQHIMEVVDFVMLICIFRISFRFDVDTLLLFTYYVNRFLGIYFYFFRKA